MRLSEIMLSQSRLLNEIFGPDTYQIEATDDVAFVRTDWMELKLAYDPRDQCVGSMIKPLKVPEHISEYLPTDTLLGFLDTQVRERRENRLDEEQVRDELNLVRPLVDLFKDERRSCDATWFVSGYNQAYTDYCSGKWEAD